MSVSIYNFPLSVATAWSWRLFTIHSFIIGTWKIQSEHVTIVFQIHFPIKIKTLITWKSMFYHRILGMMRRRRSSSQIMSLFGMLMSLLVSSGNKTMSMSVQNGFPVMDMPSDTTKTNPLWSYLLVFLNQHTLSWSFATRTSRGRKMSSFTSRFMKKNRRK